MLSNLPSSPGGDVMINISEKTNGTMEAYGRWHYYFWMEILPITHSAFHTALRDFTYWMGCTTLSLCWTPELGFGRKELKRIEIGYWRSNRRPPSHLTLRWSRSGLHGWQWQVKFSWWWKKNEELKILNSEPRRQNWKGISWNGNGVSKWNCSMGG